MFMVKRRLHSKDFFLYRAYYADYDTAAADKLLHMSTVLFLSTDF